MWLSSTRVQGVFEPDNAWPPPFDAPAQLYPVFLYGFTFEDGSNNAVFFEEEDRFVLGDMTLTEVMSDDQNPEELLAELPV